MRLWQRLLWLWLWRCCLCTGCPYESAYLSTSCVWGSRCHPVFAQHELLPQMLVIYLCIRQILPDKGLWLPIGVQPPFLSFYRIHMSVGLLTFLCLQELRAFYLRPFICESLDSVIISRLLFKKRNHLERWDLSPILINSDALWLALLSIQTIASFHETSIEKGVAQTFCPAHTILSFIVIYWSASIWIPSI